MLTLSKEIKKQLWNTINLMIERERVKIIGVFFVLWDLEDIYLLCLKASSRYLIYYILKVDYK